MAILLGLTCDGGDALGVFIRPKDVGGFIYQIAGGADAGLKWLILASEEFFAGSGVLCLEGQRFQAEGVGLVTVGRLLFVFIEIILAQAATQGDVCGDVEVG